MPVARRLVASGCWPVEARQEAARLEDRSTAIRQLVDQALRDLTTREALQVYQQGRMTLRDFARSLRLDVWAAQDLLSVHGVAVAQGGRGETAAALAALLAERDT